MTRILTLYSRLGCHLCESMERALAERRGRLDFTARTVDVDDDPQLQSRFGDQVPVLMAGDREICRYVLDERALEACLNGPRRAR